MLGLKDNFGGIVVTPVEVGDAAFSLHTGEETGTRIRCENMRCHGLDTILDQPGEGVVKDIGSIVIETEYHTGVYHDVSLVDLLD